MNDKLFTKEQQEALRNAYTLSNNDNDLIKFAEDFLKNKKCIVENCENRFDQGVFVGDFCSPCFKTITEGNINSQLFRNILEKIIKDFAKKYE